MIGALIVAAFGFLLIVLGALHKTPELISIIVGAALIVVAAFAMNWPRGGPNG